MSTSVLQCPNCGTDLTEALAKQLREEIGTEFRQKFLDSKKVLEEQSRQQQQALENELTLQRRQFEQLRNDAAEQQRRREEEFRKQWDEQRQELHKQAQQQAQEQLSTEVQAMREHIAEQQERLRVQSEKELELLRKTRELEQQQENMGLELERRMNEERSRMREQFEVQFVEQQRLRELEKDKKIDDMQKLIDDLQRKSQQGSQQTQGEVLELELEQALRSAFVWDEIKPVPKGVKGADVVHRVIEQGRDSGIILWEFKRTKSWNKEWINKLKEDVRDMRAHIAVIVTSVLPDGVESFAMIDGVWVCDVRFAVPLASVLRDGVIEVAKQRVASEGKSEKMEMLYHYLTGQEFAQHMQSMMEVFITMRKELDDEKRAYEKIWAKREKQIERTQRSAIRIRGDLEGIVGAALPPVQNLQLPEGD